MAAANCARAGKTSDLDIWGPAPALVQRDSDTANRLRPVRKLPKRGQVVNGGAKQRYQPAWWASPGSHCRANLALGEFFGPGSDRISDKTSLIARISMAARATMMTERAGIVAAATFTPENWWLPMDTSHLAEHAGTLFASVFVVATTTMRTMIPLRIFGILTNVVLIATAIPSHNYLRLVAALRAAGPQFLSAASDAAAGARREKIGQQRSVDGMAEAVHDRAQMRGRRGAVLQGRESRGSCSTSSVAASGWWSPASNCRSAPSSANSACCRHRTCGRRRWNVSKPASFSASATARSRNSTCRTRRSDFTSFVSPVRGCSRTSRSWSNGWRSRRPSPISATPKPA